MAFRATWCTAPDGGEVAKWLNPLYGYAGYGILDSPSSIVADAYESAIFTIAQRFPGLEADYPIAHSLSTDGIKGVNWLTILANRWIDQLGGLPALKAMNSGFLKYPGGVVIQAGDQPQIGDRNGNVWPELYIKLNTAVRPVRARKTYPFQHYGENRFDPKSSREWLARFDR
jgi:hypothetical protein